MSFAEWFGYFFGGEGPSDILPPAPDGAEDFSDEFVPALAYTDHVALGLSRLIEQFKRKPKIEALLATWLRPIQSVENVMWSLKLLRGLFTSTGKQLDCIGQQVGEFDRAGDDDDRYRIRILARIAVNLSDGRREDILAVASLLLPEGAAIYAAELYPASVLYQVEEPWTGLVDGVDLAAILRRAETGGVNLDLTYSAYPSADTLTGDSSYGSATTSGQWPGSFYDSAAGGYQAATSG